MPSLSCLSRLEPGQIGSDSGSVEIPTADEPFPIEVLLYALIFVVERNTANIAVVF